MEEEAVQFLPLAHRLPPIIPSLWIPPVETFIYPDRLHGQEVLKITVHAPGQEVKRIIVRNAPLNHRVGVPLQALYEDLWHRGRPVVVIQIQATGATLFLWLLFQLFLYAQLLP
jgi:hypothetical protein